MGGASSRHLNDFCEPVSKFWVSSEVQLSKVTATYVRSSPFVNARQIDIHNDFQTQPACPNIMLIDSVHV